VLQQSVEVLVVDLLIDQLREEEVVVAEAVEQEVVEPGTLIVQVD